MSNPGVWKTWEGRVVDGKFPLRQRRIWLWPFDFSFEMRKTLRMTRVMRGEI